MEHGELMFLYAIPRLDCLGLIEATGTDTDATVPSMIPRLDCLGLIEAAWRR